MDKNQNQNDFLNLLKGKVDMSKLTPAQTNVLLQQLNQKKTTNKLNVNQTLENGNLIGVSSPLLSGLNPNNNLMALMNNDTLNSINLLNNTNQLNNLTSFLPTNNILNTPISTSAPLFLNNNLLNNNFLSNNIDSLNSSILTSLAGSTSTNTSNALNNNSLLLNKLNQNLKVNSPILNNSSVLGSTSLASSNIYPLATKTIKQTPTAATTITSTKPSNTYKSPMPKPVNKKSHIDTTYNPTITKNKKRNYSNEKLNTHSSSSHRTGKYSKCLLK